MSYERKLERLPGSAPGFPLYQSGVLLLDDKRKSGRLGEFDLARRYGHYLLRIACLPSTTRR